MPALLDCVEEVELHDRAPLRVVGHAAHGEGRVVDEACGETTTNVITRVSLGKPMIATLFVHARACDRLWILALGDLQEGA